jgi:hypothetical protein
MSTASEFRRPRDEPIDQHERRIAIALVTVLLTASTVVAAAARPAGHPRQPVPHTRSTSAPDASHPPTPAAATASVAPVTALTARGFLSGYLAYLYGHASASAIESATQALSRSLRAHPPIVPPSMRARNPRVLSLHAAPAPAGLVRVSALVNDGELASYQVDLILAHTGRRLLVTAVRGT